LWRRKSGGKGGSMAIYDIFSKRMKAERSEFPDVYQYDNFDKSLKIKSFILFMDISVIIIT
jgi:hypothetical protein